MTTATDTSVVDQTSDAGFRAWGVALNSLLAAVGLVQTADTGQINWASVTRAATNTAAGYEIWRFANSALYLKLEYGSGSTTSTPMAWVTVGTGSNGSGTLTGQTSTRTTWLINATAASTATTYTSYACHVTGGFSLVFKQNSVNSSVNPMGLLVVGQTVDSTGTITSTGYGVLVQGTAGNNGPRFQSVRTAATATTFAANSQYAQVVGDVTSSLVGANIQAYYVWLNVPDTQPFLWANVYIVAEITENNTFSVAMVSSSSHTYLAIGAAGAVAQFAGQSASSYGFGVIYE